MNTLIVGSQKDTILSYLPDRYLLIDDGPLIEQIEFPKRRSIVHFDIGQHSFNPLRDMDYQKARQFWDVLKATFPEGENTLTKANAEYQILTALLNEPKSLAELIPQSKETQYAAQMVQKLLLSSVLENVLTKPTNMSFKGTIIARLDRATLGDFDAFVLANLLISQYEGPVVIPDFGFYACKSHMKLIRQDRLIAGVSAFDQVPWLRNELVSIENKLPSQCTPTDARVFATYAGLMEHTNGYADFVERCIRPRKA